MECSTVWGSSTLALGFAAMLCVCTLVYLPDKPREPPSNSAQEARLDLKTGISRLIRYDI